jgi:hypothetical protein
MVQQPDRVSVIVDSLFERSRRSLDLLKVCASMQWSSLEAGWGERQLAAFLLWTSSIGVFARGTVSADYRLRGHQDIRLLLEDLLESLETSLEQCKRSPGI